MASILFSLVLMLGVLALPEGNASANEAGSMRALRPADAAPTFLRSRRAAAVWAGDGCWTSCEALCEARLAACLGPRRQGQCLSLAERCDRLCQRQCRRRGGPLLPLDF